MITFQQIISCNGTVLYQTIPKQNRMNFVSSGKLSVLIAYDGMILLQLNQFQYGINPNSQILYDDKDPQFSYIFHMKKFPQGYWVLKINQNADSFYSCLNQKCYLKNKRQNLVKNQKVQIKQKVVNKKVDLEYDNVQKENYQQQIVKEKSILVQASKGLGKGLVFGGKIISKGLSSLGGLISKKVQPVQEHKVSESTQNNIDLAKKTTKNVLNFTAQQVGALFRFGKSVAIDASQTFQKSEKGKQLQKKQYYEPVKQGVKTGVTVLANIYEGAVNAVYQIGSGISNGTTKIIGAKYGKEAQTAADGMLQGVGNVAKIVRIPKDQAAKAFKQ